MFFRAILNTTIFLIMWAVHSFLGDVFLAISNMTMFLIIWWAVYSFLGLARPVLSFVTLLLALLLNPPLLLATYLNYYFNYYYCNYYLNCYCYLHSCSTPTATCHLPQPTTMYFLLLTTCTLPMPSLLARNTFNHPSCFTLPHPTPPNITPHHPTPPHLNCYNSPVPFSPPQTTATCLLRALQHLTPPKIVLKTRRRHKYQHDYSTAKERYSTISPPPTPTPPTSTSTPLRPQHSDNQNPDTSQIRRSIITRKKYTW